MNAVDRGPGRTCVLILGMHRSGTSAVTRVLSLLGADLPKTLMSPQDANAAGYWESPAIMAINDDLLAKAGSRWDDWAHFDEKSLSASDLVAFERQIIETLDKEVGDAPLIALKDPRIARLAPLYIRILRAHGFDVRCVHITRSPVEVAHSLHERDKLATEFSQLLWLRHTLAAEQASRGNDRIFVTYDSLMSDDTGTIRRLAEWGGRFGLSTTAQSINKAAGHIQGKLRHFVDNEEWLHENDDALLGLVARTYGAIKSMTHDMSQPDVLATLDASLADLDRIAAISGDAVNKLIADTAIAHRERDDLRRTLTSRLAASEHESKLARQGYVDAVAALRSEAEESRQKVTDIVRESKLTRQSHAGEVAVLRGQTDDLRQSLTTIEREQECERKSYAAQVAALCAKTESLRVALRAGKRNQDLADKEHGRAVAVLCRQADDLRETLTAQVTALAEDRDLARQAHVDEVAGLQAQTEDLRQRTTRDLATLTAELAMAAESHAHQIRQIESRTDEIRQTLKNQISVLQNENDMLRKTVTKLLRSPLVPLRDRVRYHGARKLEKLMRKSNPVSAQKYARSAAKRDPKRFMSSTSVSPVTPDTSTLPGTANDGHVPDHGQDPRQAVSKRTGSRFAVLEFWLLRALSKASPPLPTRMASRFARSAAKRDPSIIAVPVEEKIPDSEYGAVRQAWAKQRRDQICRIATLSDELKNGPLISVLVPVYNPDPALLALMIDSVLTQSYGKLELCIADDCSSDPEVRRVLKRYARRDRRIKLVLRKENGHISRATNSALDVAKGQFVALLDHDDILDQDALLLMAQAIAANPNVRILYSDEDKIHPDGVHFDPHFKPDWNRDLLYCCNYVSHLGVYETALMREVGGFRVGFEGAQDHDLLLRCVEKVSDSQIVHVPKVLYSWRATPGSTAASRTAKPYTSAAGERAVAEHLKRTTGHDVPVGPGPVPFTYRANWTIEGNPLVSIIIPTRDHLDVLKVAVDSILTKTDYTNFELLIVDNGSVEPSTLQWFDQITVQDRRVQVRKDDRPFNYSALNNAAVAQCSGEFVALVNNDVEVISPGWLSEMVGLAQRPGTGCVGAKLYYPDGRIQHGGVIVGLGGVAGHSHLFFPPTHPGYQFRLGLRQNYTAVTGACLLVRRGIFDEVGGLNETDLAIAFNDVDFCLKVDAAGYRNVWTPWAELVHHESISRGYEDTPEKQARFGREVDYMKRRWKTDEIKDPAYNPNLTLDRQDFGLADAQWALT